MAKKSATEGGGLRARSAGRRRKATHGPRQIYSQKLHPEVEQKLDLLMFLRESAYRARQFTGESRPKPTRDELWDEALKEFFQVVKKLDHYRFPAPPKIGARKSFWVDVNLSVQCERLAAARGINVARILDAAISDYLSRRVGPTIMKFMKAIGNHASDALAQGERSAEDVISGSIETEKHIK